MSETLPNLGGLTEENLLSRAIRNARDTRKRKGQTHPRWVAVAHVYNLNRPDASELCRQFGFNPGELVAL